MNAPRDASLDRAKDLADQLTQAYDAEVRVNGGFFRLEVASATLRFIEAIGRLDPGFIPVMRDALNNRPLAAPAGPANSGAEASFGAIQKRPPMLAPDRIGALALNACWFAAGAIAACGALTIVIALEGLFS